MANFNCSVSDEISAQIELAPDSLWFSGHFPGHPVLPGIAQLGMVLDLLELAKNQKLKVAGVNRVKFKRMIRPGDRLHIVIRPVPEKTGTFSFRVSVDQAPAASGFMTLHMEPEQGR